MPYHDFVPDASGHGVTVPVIKDRLGDALDASSLVNYRPITLDSVRDYTHWPFLHGI